MIIFDDRLPLNPDLLDKYLWEALARLRVNLGDSAFKIASEAEMQRVLYLPDGALGGWFTFAPRIGAVRLQVYAAKVEGGRAAITRMMFYLLEIVYGAEKALDWGEKLPDLIERGGIQEYVLMPILGELAQLVVELDRTDKPEPEKPKKTGGRPASKDYDLLASFVEAGMSLPNAMERVGGLDPLNPVDVDKARKAIRRRTKPRR